MKTTTIPATYSGLTLTEVTQEGRVDFFITGIDGQTGIKYNHRATAYSFNGGYRFENSLNSMVEKVIMNLSNIDVLYF